MLQKLAMSWDRIKQHRRTVIHIPSLGLSQDIRDSINEFGIRQNTQMARICDIRGTCWDRKVCFYEMGIFIWNRKYGFFPIKFSLRYTCGWYLIKLELQNATGFLRNSLWCKRYIIHVEMKQRNNFRFSLIFGTVVYCLRFFEILIVVSVWQCLKWYAPVGFSDPNVDVIFVSPVPLSEETLQYYSKLLGLKSAVESGVVEDQCDMGEKYKIIVPEAIKSFPVSQLAAISQLVLIPSLFDMLIKRKCTINDFTYIICNKRPTGLKGHLNSRDHIHSLHRYVFD